MTTDTINNLIGNFSIELLQQFFRENIRTFKAVEENYEYLFEDNEDISEKYFDIYKRGEANLSNSNDLSIITATTSAPLTYKTGKKQQFEIAKKILQEESKDAAFFIFYDEKGDFRFSLIRAEYLGVNKKFTNFKRYTYFVSKSLTNKTFINQVSKANFNDLDSILEAFNVEPISKQFYEQLQHWYFWAIENVEFPKDAENEKNGREIAVIRLITRLMFVWFMKVRNLIPNDLFDEEKIHSILKDDSPENSDYYKAILQNLFFATLNTKQKDRKYRCEERGNKGYNTDFGNHNVFRYQDCFKDADLLKSLFSEIPFLNGGLFDCLDYKTKVKEDRKYIDGFTAIKSQQPQIPNSLFFSEPKKQDLSRFYDKSNKKKLYEVEGIINLLNRYNFTIDENEPDDIEVALDPELLGSIFENLLASYNPETATTARKATGSFYTPREIVNYMTTESLKQYFKTALKDDAQQTEPGNGSELEKDIDSLLQSNTSENPFDKISTTKIITLINELRVVDPAVGSGAFPMAMLNKLVFILEKLDPQNHAWKQSQIDSVKQSIADPVVQRKLIAHIEKQFSEKNADYGRKLYLIEKCIYGVDIQQIAVEIAKLRFFISLLVDEKIDLNKPETNYGIEPLPNLDFKLMQGNSLISEFMGLNFDKNEKEKFDSIITEKENQIKEMETKQKKVESDFLVIFKTEKRQDKKLKSELTKLEKSIKKLEMEIKELHANKDRNDSKGYKRLIKKFEDLKNEYLNVSDKKEKDAILEKIEKTILNIFEEKINEHIPQLKIIEEKYATLPNKQQREKAVTEEKQKLTRKLGFDIEEKEKELIAYTGGRKPKDFFLWNLYFAEVFTENNGFDIVIGNPPYGFRNVLTKEEKKYFREIEKIEFRSGDSAELFCKKSFENLVTKKGVLSFIIPKKCTYGDSWNGWRTNYFQKYDLQFILDAGKAFDKVLLEQTAFGLVKQRQNGTVHLGFLDNKKDKLHHFSDSDKKRIFKTNNTLQIYLEYFPRDIFSKIQIKTDENIFISGDLGLGIGTNFFSNKETSFKLLKGIDIERWKVKSHRYLKNKSKLNWKNASRFLKPKVIAQVLVAHIENPTPHLKITACLDSEGIIITNTLTTFVLDKSINEKFWLAYLNSSLVSWYTYNYIYGRAIRTMHLYSFYIEQIPIPKITKLAQQPFLNLVDKIIAKKEAGKDITAEEQEIDLLVYDLYGLTEEEIQIVEESVKN